MAVNTAEVTKSPEADDEEELSFGKASLPRSQRISEVALNPPEYSAVGSKGRRYTGCALVIDDMAQHSRSKDHAFAGSGVTFYCGVPIVSKVGHHIGVYSISDDNPRNGLTPSELIFMQDTAQIVMKHLRSVYNDPARHREDRLVMALGQYVQGMSSMHDSTGWSSETKAHPTSQYGLKNCFGCSQSAC